MKRKIIIVLLFILFVISLSCSIIGYLNKDKTSTESNYKKIAVYSDLINIQEESVEIENLDNKLLNFEFLKANKYYNGKKYNVKIYNDELIIAFKSSEENDFIDTYTFHCEALIDAVQGQLSEDETELTLYFLSNNQLYRYKLNTDKNEERKIEMKKYELDNVLGFQSFFGKLNNNNEREYVVIKTKDSKYYTDYNFNKEEDTLKQLINKEVESNEE